jgi:type IV pilus assembly protein PilC
MQNISNTLRYRWYNVLLAAITIGLVYFYVRDVAVIRYQWDRLILKIWKIGPLLRAIYTARFARTISSLYGSGIQLVTAVGVSGKIIGNRYVEAQFDEVVKRIRQGELLSATLAGIDGFNEKLRSTIVIGEETGKLDEILTHTSVSFEYDSETALDGMLTMILPVLLVFMSVIILLVIVSVMMPIYQLYQSVDSFGGM